MKNILQRGAEVPMDTEPPMDTEAPAGAEGDMSTMDDPEYLAAKELALSKLYEEGAAEGIIKAMQSYPDPVAAIVEQAGTLLRLVDDASPVPDEMLLVLGLDLLQEVVDIGKSAGMQITGQVVAEAVRGFLAAVVEELGGDPSGVAQAMGAIDPQQAGAALDAAEAAEYQGG